jgi:serine/threonine-protein kinase
MLTEGQILEKKYRVGRLLGKGGMGAVFLGEHTLIKRAVAIKVLHEIDPNSENAKRFEKEAQAAGRIGSDHIVEVLDLGTTPDGDRFMVMEYLDGESLKERLARGRLSPAELVPLVTQVLEGLTAAHAAGIVHRDLKPDNIYILKEKAGRKDFVKIVDFGISKFNALGAEGAMTQAGAVMGTPYYMSPEQARAANEVDERSDVYAIGVLMYQAVTGSVPFQGTTLTELLFKIVFEEAPHPSSIVPDLDEAFSTIVLKAMARDPGDRHPTASALREALTSWREGPRAPQAGAPLALPPASQRAVAPRAPEAAPLAAGTAILDASSNPFGQSQPHAPAPPPPRPLAQSAAQPVDAARQSWQQPPPQQPQQQPFAPSMSSGSQTLDTPRPPAKSRAGVFALVAFVVLGLGGAAAFVATRPAKATADAGAGTASAAIAAPTAAPSALATASPSASTTAAEAPSASPTTTASAAVPARPAGAGARPLASAKPSAATASPAGKLKDLGY